MDSILERESNEERGFTHDRPGEDPRRAGAQPEKYRRRRPAGQDRRHRRGVRLRQVLPRPRRPLCRRVEAVPRVPLHLHPPPDDRGGPGGCGRGALPPGGPRPPPAPRRPRHPLHLRHRNRAAERPAADVFKARIPSLPERTLPAAVAGGGGGTAAKMPRLRRGVLRPGGGGTGLQQRGRLPEVRRHRDGEDGRPLDPRAGRDADHRGGGGRPLELADVVADGGRLPGDGGADRRPLSGPDPGGKGDRLRRPAREKAHLLPPQKRRAGRGAGLYLLQRRLYR